MTPWNMGLSLLSSQKDKIKNKESNKAKEKAKEKEKDSTLVQRMRRSRNLQRDEASSNAVNTDGNDSSSTDYDAPSTHRFRVAFHVRSMSNPFPALFSGRKGKNKKSDSTAGPQFPLLHSSESDDEADMASPRPDAAKDFVTGSCMTCGSTVRWPKVLDVFKCTICVTINDLTPLGTKQNRDRSSRNGRGNAPRPPYSSISLEHSKHIVRQCLQTHLARQLWGPSAEDRGSVYAYGSTARAASDGDIGMSSAPPHRGTPPSSIHQGLGNGQQWTDYTPRYVFDEQPTLRPNPLRQSPSRVSGYSATSFSERPHGRAETWGAPPPSHKRAPSQPLEAASKLIFKPLEDYLIDCFSSFDCVNEAFLIDNARHSLRSRSEYTSRTPQQSTQSSRHQVRNPTRDRPFTDSPVCQVDPKILLLGDFAENGTWWAGGQSGLPASRPSSMVARSEMTVPLHATQRSPEISWNEVTDWYSVIINAAQGWFAVYEELCQHPNHITPTEATLQRLERELLEAQAHVQRVLLKCTETLLKRIGGRITEAADLRFLLIILENPLLHTEPKTFNGVIQPDVAPLSSWQDIQVTNSTDQKTGPLFGQHSGIVKRIVGLISNAPDECHNHLITWFARYPNSAFTRLKDLIYGFLTYRMLRQNEKKQQTRVDVTAGLVPQLQDGRSGASLHEAIGTPRRPQKTREQAKHSTYSEDWQVRAAARTLSLVFAANNLQLACHGDDRITNDDGHNDWYRESILTNKSFLPNTDFYSSMLDFVDLVADFENWESRKAKFSFCQYPFLLSIWAKTQILEHDAQRQMKNRARDAFFDSIMSRRTVSQYLNLDVRRECLVDDSLQAVGEIIGSGTEDVKKAIRITFRGEEGIDGGGLRKEWFLLLIREVFNPDHGMFVYDDESHCCYFNPHALETSDQFFLVGVVMGLAIYNSTILDVALPPFAFRKLLASAPFNGTGQSLYPRYSMRYTLDDLGEYRPSLCRGLKQLLNHEGNVEDLDLTFAVDTNKYGHMVRIPLCEGGEDKPVTNANRKEYVDLYVRYVLDTAVSRQFEPFKRGFYTVCGGNAFSLFRPEEIELLIRGSDEALDIGSLRAAAIYDNWGIEDPDGSEPVVGWFWETFQEASPKDQRSLLSFITGSDRLPATGASMMPIKISCLGDDCGRYPIARTCFNYLSLWRYRSKQKLEFILWRAVHESEGFGLK